MRIARRLIVTAGILALLFVGANIVAQRVAESRIASQAQKSFGSQTKPVVTLDTFILLDLWHGRIAHAGIDGRGLVVAGLDIAHARITLEGIRAKFSDLTTGGAMHVDRGLATAEVTSAAVTAYVRKQTRKNVTVAIRNGGVTVSGTVRVGGGSAHGTAEGTPQLVGRILSFTPARVSVNGSQLKGASLAHAKKDLSFQVEVPTLPGGIRITAIQYHSGVAELIAHVRNASIDISRSGS